MKSPATVSAVLLALVATAAHAGNYARGYGSTATEATDNALKAAEAAVTSMKKGCVGPGRDGQPAMRYVGKEADMFVFEAHYNNQNGSCGIKKTPAEYMKDLGF